MNRVANLSTADVSLRAAARRRAHHRLPFNFADALIVMVMLAASLICFSYYRQMQGKLADARAAHDSVSAQIAAAQLQNQRIAAEINDLRSNPVAIERAARQELGMVRPGEIVLAVDSRDWPR